jgi:hypothetical protein
LVVQLVLLVETEVLVAVAHQMLILGQVLELAAQATHQVHLHHKAAMEAQVAQALLTMVVVGVVAHQQLVQREQAVQVAMEEMAQLHQLVVLV